MRSETNADTTSIKKIKKAFTLVELVISIFISSIVLLFILIFLWDTIDMISEWKNDTKIFIAFSEFSNKINNYRNIYSSWSIIINNNSFSWSDVLLLKNINWTDWIIISRIDLDTKKIILDNTIYKNSPIWIRRVSQQEISNIDYDINVVKNYIFHNDQIFNDLILKDLQIEGYNSETIFEFSMEINPIFIKNNKWSYWNFLKTDNLLNLNMYF